MYKCELCSKSFKGKYGLDYHVTKNVCQKQKKICNSCGKCFATQTGYLYHINNKVCANTIKPKIKLKTDSVVLFDNLNKLDLYEENLRFVFPCFFG